MKYALHCIFSIVSWSFWDNASHSRVRTTRASKPPMVSTMRTYARGLLRVCLRRRMKLQTLLILYKKFHKPRRRLRARFLGIVRNRLFFEYDLASGVHGRHTVARVRFLWRAGVCYDGGRWVVPAWACEVNNAKSFHSLNWNSCSPGS